MSDKNIVANNQKYIVVNNQKYNFLFYNEETLEGFFLMEKQPEDKLITEEGIAMCEDTSTGVAIMHWYRKNLATGEEKTGIVRSLYDETQN